MKRRRRSLFFTVAVFAFAIYSLYTLVSLQIEINQKKSQAAELTTQIEEQKITNAELDSVLKSGLSSSYIEKIARDKLGLAMPNERVFINPEG